MVNKKWILLFLLAQFSIAQTSPSTDDLELEQRISESLNASVQTKKSVAHSLSIGQLVTFLKSSDGNQKNCVDTKKVTFAEKYVLTYDSQGNPCRIYDLSFPNLKALMKTSSFFQVPIRRLTSKDFLNALDNDWNSIQYRNRDFSLMFNPRKAAKTSFVSTLKFKNRPQSVWGSQTNISDIGLPKSFSLADLDINSNLQIPTEIKVQMAELLTQLEYDSTMSAERNNQMRRYFLQVTNSPETLLASVKFKFNDLNKVYDVFVDADFLPLMGPVEIVNFQKQYKGTVEKLLRNLLSGVLTQLPRLIPNRTIAAIVEVVIEDLFEQIDLMYEYQTNRLEHTLKNLKNYPGLAATDTLQLETRALNILYGQKSDLVSSYLMSVVQGAGFDWQAFEKLGHTNRYNLEKQRQILMDKTHSRLVLEKKCQTEIVNEYFAVCSKNGEKNGLYSLISEQSIPFKNLGAPLVHRFARPYEVPLIRGGIWLLSVGLRIVGLPLNRTITYQLNESLKNFMRSGILDEAYLQNELYSNQLKGTATQESKKLLAWLYIQNLNPLMPKTFQFENSVIKANKSILETN